MAENAEKEERTLVWTNPRIRGVVNSGRDLAKEEGLVMPACLICHQKR